VLQGIGNSSSLSLGIVGKNPGFPRVTVLHDAAKLNTRFMDLKFHPKVSQKKKEQAFHFLW
jgi:hypothetical protein